MKTKKKPVKKAAKRIWKPKTVLTIIAEPPPVFRNKKILRDFTENPTPAAIDAAYGYLKRAGKINEGSPALRRLNPFWPHPNKLAAVRAALCTQ